MHESLSAVTRELRGSVIVGSLFARLPAFALVVATMLAVCTSAANSQTTDDDLTNRVHFGDIIDVDVAGGYEFDWRGKLDPEGFLDGLNTYGDPVRGLCRTPTEIAADVAKELKKLLRDPKVTVRIIDRSGRAVAVIEGAVKSPQRFQLRREAHLRELIVLSGGISDDAGGEIRLFRPPNLSCSTTEAAPDGTKSNAPDITTIKIADILKGNADADPLIKSGDQITVLRVVPIYVIGGVNDPKPIVSRPGLTLSRAIAMAGGLSKEADKGQVTIYRREGTDSSVTQADLDKIAAGSADDPVLKPLDIVEIGQKGRAKRKYPPVLATNSEPGRKELPLRIVD
jgi:polysaccharide export outer membrane protein